MDQFVDATVVIVAGLLLSGPHGMSYWLGIQKKKVGTCLAYGRSTPGIALPALIVSNSLCIFVVYGVYRQVGLTALIILPVMWICGRYWAVLIERKAYARELALLLLLAERLMKEFSASVLKAAIEDSLPLWWINMMPPEWKDSYFKGIVERFQKIHGDSPVSEFPYVELLAPFMKVRGA